MLRYGRYVGICDMRQFLAHNLIQFNTIPRAKYSNLPFPKLLALTQHHTNPPQDLTTHRTNAHMTYLLTTTLSNLPSLAPSLPPDLHIPIALITALLTGKIPPKDHPILTPDTQVFLSNADIIASALSTHLQQTASLLCTLSSPLSPPPPSSLPTTASSLRTDASQDLPSTLSSSKTHLSNSAHEVLSLHLALLHAAILILERTQHGALARSTAATAENVSARATLLGARARVQVLGSPLPEEYVGALKGFRSGLRGVERGLRDREGVARGALELYKGAGERGMRDLAGRKAVLLKEIERVEGEVGGLEAERKR